MKRHIILGHQRTTSGLCVALELLQNPYSSSLFWSSVFWVFCFLYMLCVQKSLGRWDFFFFFLKEGRWDFSNSLVGPTHFPPITTTWQVLKQARAIKEVSAFSFQLNWNENTERRVTSLRLFCFFLWVRLFCFCYQNFFF